MFDAETAELLRSAPGMPGVDPTTLPAILTRHYAELVSHRLHRMDTVRDEDSDDWSLKRLADAYELTATLQRDSPSARAAAFVAATAQQILARRQQMPPNEINLPNISRDRLDPALAAVLLFLLAEQFADANEAAAATVRAHPEIQLHEATILSKHIIDLGQGRLYEILGRSERWRDERQEIQGIEERALAALFETIATGIEIFAATFLKQSVPIGIKGRYESARDAFERVINFSTVKSKFVEPFGSMTIVFAGPHHLASLLISVTDGIESSSLMDIPPPNGTNAKFWDKWLRYRSKKFPYVWANHRKAVECGFHETGLSGVVVLPTGAGKTTISSLKIAAVLARGKKVVFLVPTHALVEQLTEDLQEIFPRELLGSVVSSDFDLLFLQEASFRDVEVMTPERCLAMLSFVPDAFEDVGLLVFDECHLLSPTPSTFRRALDGMLCVLGFNHVAPNADILFLSAMVKNGEELADWLAGLTNRPRFNVDLIWKPSRQARGVVTYDSNELKNARSNAVQKQSEIDRQSGIHAVSLRSDAKKQLHVQPFAIWGLQHNWLSEKGNVLSFTPLLSDHVPLAGALEHGSSVRLTPNANVVSGKIAAAAAAHGLKTILFVNTKSHAVKVANDVSGLIRGKIKATEEEYSMWTALELELGDLSHSLLAGPAIAVPHNSAMLKLERNLAERMFKRPDGANVIVATPTLAQGLNLPAHLAIIAGDKRSDTQGERRALEAHEILNAAARAGRAGHLANGLVLLVPEPIMSFSPNETLSQDVVKKLAAVFPEDDHCVVISDPLQIVLDRVNNGNEFDRQVKYTINRFADLPTNRVTTGSGQLFDLKKSFAAYSAKRAVQSEKFNTQVEAFMRVIEEHHVGGSEATTAILATQSGLSSVVIQRLEKRIRADVGKLPEQISDWIEWTTDWLIEDEEARLELLSDIHTGILKIAGKNINDSLDEGALRYVQTGLLAWIRGEPLCKIEELLGGDPNGNSITKKTCPRARELVGTIIPRGYSFVLGIVSHIVKIVDPFEKQNGLDRKVVECMGISLRRGFDTTDKLFFARDNKDALGRVQAHKKWHSSNPGE